MPNITHLSFETNICTLDIYKPSVYIPAVHIPFLTSNMHIYKVCIIYEHEYSYTFISHSASK